METTNDTTNKYKCGRCGFSCKYRYILVRHLEGKRTCKPLISNVTCSDLLTQLDEQQKRNSVLFCNKCGKGFNTAQGVAKHEKKCVAASATVKEEQSTDNKQLLETLLKEFAEQKEHQHQQEQEIKTLKQVLMNQNIPISHTTTNIGTQNNNITNNVTQNINIIVPFGQENTDFIKHLVNFMNDCCSRPESGVTKIIKTIHFHPNRPENYNITFADGKIMTYDGEEWSVPPSKNKVLDDTIEKAVDIMDTHYITKLETDPDPKHIITKSSMIAFQRKIHRKDLEVIRGLRRNTEQLIKAETEKVHSKHPNLPSTQ
jgi:hypothetical protein